MSEIQRPAAETEVAANKYDKIGGWLFLVVIGLIITPLRLGYSLVVDFYPLMTDGSWSILTTPGSEAYHPLWAPLLVFEIVGNCITFLAAIVILVFFFMRKKFVPLAMIVFYSFNLFFVATDYFAADLIPAVAAQDSKDSLRELLRTAVAAAIWIPYFIMSKRVKGTFVK